MRPVLFAAIFALASAAAEFSMCASKPGEDVDCSFSNPDQKSSAGACTVKYYPTNGSDCAALSLEPSKETHRLGDASLSPFVWDYKNEHYYKYSLFNVTFANIRWKHMTFRFRAADNNITGELKNHCREIVFSGNRSDLNISPLHYDCHWSDQDRRYENETFIFETLSVDGERSDYKKYVFKVPPVRYLEEINRPYLYMDLTEPKKIFLHIVLLNWNNPIRKFQIETCFLNKEKVSTEAKCETDCLNIENSNTSVFVFEPKRTGWYFFKVTLVDSACSPNCVSTTSIEFYIDCHNIVYTVLWNVLWICIAFGLIFAIIWIVKRCRRRYMPHVLLMYSHHDNFHLPIINLLRKYMQNELNWNVMWDQEIELTEHGDPYIWCLDACTKADCILYFSKPLNCNVTHSDSVNSVNPHVHMNEIFFKVIKIASQKKKIHLYNVVLNNCGNPDTPLDFRKIRTFSLMNQWNLLVNNVMKNNWFDKRIRPVPNLNDSIVGRDIINVCSRNQ